MKSSKTLIIVVGIFMFMSSNSFGQTQKTMTVEFEVKGVCNQCKARIENAAYIKGVKHCEWNKETGIITVTYSPKRVNIDDIHTSIAEAGHSTSMMEADKEAYEKLPKCCAYDDGVDTH